MASFTIRPAGLADAGILADLGARTFRETFESICSSEDLAAYVAATYGEACQRAELADPARPGMILEVDGVPAGFVQLRLGHREPAARAYARWSCSASTSSAPTTGPVLESH